MMIMWLQRACRANGTRGAPHTCNAASAKLAGTTGSAMEASRSRRGSVTGSSRVEPCVRAAVQAQGTNDEQVATLTTTGYRVLPRTGPTDAPLSTVAKSSN